MLGMEHSVQGLARGEACRVTVIEVAHDGLPGNTRRLKRRL
jgi:hypothetical protein